MLMKFLVVLNMSKTRIKKAFSLIFLLFWGALVYNLLSRPVDLITGGTGSIAIILEFLFNFDPSITIFVIYSILFLLCLLTLSKDDIIAAAIVTIVYPIFVELTLNISNIIYIEVDNTLLIALISGVLNGVINGFIYKLDLNPGGLGIISKIVSKYYNISVTKVSLFLNTLIIMFGAVLFGINMILYAVVYLYISKVVSDRIIIGISRNKVFHVLSIKYKEIKKVLSDEFLIDCTIYDVKNSDKKFLMVVVSNKDYYLVKEVIKKIDCEAFSFISDGYEVKGENRLIRVKN